MTQLEELTRSVQCLVGSLAFEIQRVAMIHRQCSGKSSRNNVTNQQSPNSLSYIFLNIITILSYYIVYTMFLNTIIDCLKNRVFVLVITRFVFCLFFYIMAREKSNYCSFCVILKERHIVHGVWLGYQNLVPETHRGGCICKLPWMGLASDCRLFSLVDSGQRVSTVWFQHHSRGNLGVKIWSLAFGLL